MALNIKSLLRNRNVLYVVMFLSVTNFFVYILTHNWTAAVIFALIAYLTTYFSKNMIVVLSIALVSTNMIVASRKAFNVLEGMENKEEDASKKEVKKESEDNEKKSNGSGTEKYTNKSDINYAATVEKAYEDLDSLIGKDGIDKMTQDTAKLVDQQNKLLKNLESMTPLLENTGKLLNSMPINGNGGMTGIQDSITSVISSLKGMSGSKKSDE
jgi:hypothetical protein